MIKKWKIGAKKSQVSWNPQNAKNLDFFIFYYHFFICLSFFNIYGFLKIIRFFAKCSSHFPNFLVENSAKHKKSMKKSKKMMRNDKKWKINDKKMKNKWKQIGAKKSQVSWNPKHAKNLEFFHFFILFSIFHLFIIFYHFYMVSWRSSDFAKCPSHFPHFLVENAAKHKKFMKKSKNMMRNDKKMKNKW